MTTRTTLFRPHERIKDPGTFRRAFERRRWESDATLTIYGLENGLDHPRLGISVSRKKVKTAAGRNRLKRLIREAFRLSKPELPAGLDLIVVPRNPAARFAEVRRSLPELARALDRRMRSRKPPAAGVPP
jgi:ribonuclease P protein component